MITYSSQHRPPSLSEQDGLGAREGHSQWEEGWQDGGSSGEVQDGLADNNSAATSTDVEEVEALVRSYLSLLEKKPTLFDKISNKIITIANRSEHEEDARTLYQVIMLVFERAIEGSNSPQVYAKLSRKMMEWVSPKIRHEGIKSHTSGTPIVGGQLIRKFLLNKCQENFEELASLKEDGSEEVAIRRRRLVGVTKFIGELFKLQMLTERIVHECIKLLLSETEDPVHLESVCALLMTAGLMLDTPKARSHMDVYFHRMELVSESTQLPTYTKRSLKVVCNLRRVKWVPDTTLSINRQSSLDGLTETSSIPGTINHDSGVGPKNIQPLHLKDYIKLEERAITFFRIKSINSDCFIGVPPEQRCILLEWLIQNALHREERDVWLLAALFSFAASTHLLSAQSFVEAFSSIESTNRPLGDRAKLDILRKSAGLPE
ncbi:armadillo-type protein [Crepidotus variabilis]|uniref:Armadillo-type protein n=1 Tax=Crepidotus variabilis TaxID=179855 RepID=A0A9P6EIQ5_9AGAR|nr:armadillo-type protein [Crepidotus variabilis]